MVTSFGRFLIQNRPRLLSYLRELWDSQTSRRISRKSSGDVHKF